MAPHNCESKHGSPELETIFRIDSLPILAKSLKLAHQIVAGLNFKTFFLSELIPAFSQHCPSSKFCRPTLPKCLARQRHNLIHHLFKRSVETMFARIGCSMRNAFCTDSCGALRIPIVTNSLWIWILSGIAWNPARSAQDAAQAGQWICGRPLANLLKLGDHAWQTFAWLHYCHSWGWPLFFGDRTQISRLIQA